MRRLPFSHPDVDLDTVAVGDGGAVGLNARLAHGANSAGHFAAGPGETTRPFVVDELWFERRTIADNCERDGFTMTFDSAHRPLNAYRDALAEARFHIEAIREVGDPDPTDKCYRPPSLGRRTAWQPSERRWVERVTGRSTGSRPPAVDMTSDCSSGFEAQADRRWAGPGRAVSSGVHRRPAGAAERWRAGERR